MAKGKPPKHAWVVAWAQLLEQERTAYDYEQNEKYQDNASAGKAKSTEATASTASYIRHVKIPFRLVMMYYRISV